MPKLHFFARFFFLQTNDIKPTHGIQAETFEVCHYLAKFPGVTWQKSPCIDLSVLEGHNWYVRKNDNGLPFSVARQCATGWSYFCKKNINFSLISRVFFFILVVLFWPKYLVKMQLHKYITMLFHKVMWKPNPALAKSQTSVWPNARVKVKISFRFFYVEGITLIFIKQILL